MADEHDEDFSDAEYQEELRRVERVMTVEEIFEAGYNAGHANAGLHSWYEVPYRRWLSGRLERRG